MLYRAISLALVAVLLHGSIVAQDQPQSLRQTIARMQEVLHNAQKKKKAVKVTLRKLIDNQETFSGKVSEISDTGFVLTDQKTQTTKTFLCACCVIGWEILMLIPAIIASETHALLV